MTRIRLASSLRRLTACVLAGILLFAQPLLAADGGSGWRSTYDDVMMWVNFGILVLIFIKFLKNPMVDFLNLRKEKMARDIERLEEEKKLAHLKARETKELIEKGEAHIARIKQRIIEQGEQEKSRIIKQAQEQGRFMLEDAKVRAKSQLLQAQRNFKAELVEAAINLAGKQLPGEMTETDHHNLFDAYLESTSS